MRAARQSEDVQVTVDIPDGTAPGNYYVNVMTMASVPCGSDVCIGAAVVGMLEVHISGS